MPNLLTMRAYVLVRSGSPQDAFQLQEKPLPELLSTQVRIKVSAFGLNFADVMARQGLYRGMPPMPCVLGYEVEGEIEAVGSDVKDFNKGDKVFGLTRFGGYAEYAVTSAQAVGLLPDNAPTGLGCALAIQCLTAYHAAFHAQTVMPGEKVVIHAAAGGVGTALVQMAKWKGCTTIGIVGGKDKVNYLKTLGVDHIIDHHQGDYMHYVKQHFNDGVDVVFDNVGGKSIHKAKSILAPGGRIVSFGAAALSGHQGKFNLLRLVWGFGLFSPIQFLGRSQALIGINMLKLADHRPDIIESNLQGVLKLYHQGVLTPHVGQIFPNDELWKAHQIMEDRKAIGKMVVTWS